MFTGSATLFARSFGRRRVRRNAHRLVTWYKTATLRHLLGTVIQLPAFSHQTQRGFPGWTHQPPQVFPEDVETLYNPAASSEDYKHLLTVAASEFIVPRRFWNFTVGRTRVDRFYAVVYTGVSHFTAGTYVFPCATNPGAHVHR